MLNMNPFVLFQYLLNVFYSNLTHLYVPTLLQGINMHSIILAESFQKKIFIDCLYICNLKSQPLPIVTDLTPRYRKLNKFEYTTRGCVHTSYSFFLPIGLRKKTFKDFFLYFSNVKIYPPPLFGTTLI